MKKIMVILGFCVVVGIVFYQTRMNDQTIVEQQREKCLHEEIGPPVSHNLKLLRFTTKNGVNVIYKKDSNSKVVSIKFSIKGLGHENYFDPGLLDVFSQAIMRGTATKTQEQVNAILSGHYISLGFNNNGLKHLGGSLSFLLQDKDIAVELFNDIILNAKFDKNELKQVKQEFLNGLAQAKKSPRYLVKRQIDKILLDDHRYFNILHYNEKDINNITTSMLHKYLRRINKDELTVTVCSNLNKKDIEPIIDAMFNGLAQSDYDSDSDKKDNDDDNQTTGEINNEEEEYKYSQPFASYDNEITSMPFTTVGDQSYTRFIFQCCSTKQWRNVKTYAKYLLLEQLLNKLLYEKIRSELGMVYIIRASLGQYIGDCLLIQGVAMLKIDDIQRFNKELRSLIAGLVKNCITKQQLKQLKIAACNSVHLSINSSSALNSRMMSMVNNNFKLNHYDRLTKELNRIKYKEFNDFIQSNLNHEHILVVYHDPKKPKDTQVK